ncbi:SIR2 family protein [Anaerosalibacter bizertensis]|uniref:SIR2 family protein n=1 Tax=Anaerosalibacter bizertensis TaxID=932217 RepID=A0A9Q4FMQ4_9FIRM|nr:SIR2 family protein [Anaerosalibacter bizertensis]MBV1820427.1 SIR2 family protein [Bacteroidales bacterium MSK.15.36]MCG4566017.1 SIR2 family protein [Anaerosalibacter bizertensis]MCG4583417.1 SIR2 family protein [Anaerosalibacter bizertensis]
MSKNTLDLLVRNNEFPILFIGSGISKRYLKNYPSWQELLKEIWEDIGISKDFYGYLNLTKKELRDNNYDKDIDFEVNVRVADELENKIDNIFYNDNFKIDNLDQKTAYEEEISPFKKLLSNRFIKYEYKKDMEDELELFEKMILKSQIILTTNYDNFIEDSYNEISKHEIKKYVGQNGFFQQTPGYAEIYKIHGCSTDPNSLVITSRDYREFDKKSVLISSKIISMLLHSPIIFLGYSLKDRNIRKIIKEFSSSLNRRERNSLGKRIILINREKGQEKIIEEINTDANLGCRMTILRTDNYAEVYRKISSINQGVAPSEIRRYQHVIKKLIISRGKKCQLDTLLMSPNELEDIEETLNNKNLVIAIGDKAIIYKMPSTVQYMYEYISENYNQNIDVILRFIAAQ